MHGTLRWAAAAALLIAAETAGAQRSPPGLELGVDAALAHISTDLPNSSITEVNLPVQAVRLGVELTPTVWLEPALGLQHVSGNGSFTMLTFDLGLPINLSGNFNQRATQYFVRPLIGFRHFSSTDSETQTAFGAGVGVRIPIVDRLATRLEARYVRGLRSGIVPASDEFSFLVGLSFFTR